MSEESARHTADLDEIRRRDQQREYERGQREARDLAHTAEQDKALSALTADVSELKERLSRMEKSFGEFAAVANAIAEKGVTTRTFIIGVMAVLVPIIVLFLTSAKVHA